MPRIRGGTRPSALPEGDGPRGFVAQIGTRGIDQYDGPCQQAQPLGIDHGAASGRMKSDHVGLAGSLLEGDRASPALDDRRGAEHEIGSQYVAADSAEPARHSTAGPPEPNARPA